MTKILMQDKNTRKRSRKVLGAIIVVVFCLLAAIYIVVEKSGKWLVANDEFKHVTWAVILDGQSADMERNDFVADLKEQYGLDAIPPADDIMIRAAQLPDFHKDPADRIIIATSLAYNLTVVTGDGKFPQYGVRTIC